MTTTDSIKTLIDKSKDYIETKIELTRLKTIDKSADILSAVVMMVAMLFIGALFIVFVSVGLALVLGAYLGSYHTGFFIVGGFYGLVLILLYVQREKWVKAPVANGLINKMLK